LEAFNELGALRDDERARPEALAERFGAAAKALSEKVLFNCTESDPVFWAAKSVPFVRKDEIGNGRAT
jgi:hypothetical protein